MIRRLLLVAIAAGVVLATGCKNRCCQKNATFRPAPYRPPAPNAPVGPYLLPPAGVPTSPATIPPGATVVPPVGPGTPVDPRNYPPPDFGPAPVSPTPVKPAPEVLLPDPVPGSGSSRSSSSPGDAGYGILGTPAKPPSAEPPVAAKAVATTGLPGFVKVKDGLAAGGKPTLEGFDSLKQSGYRTVVYLHGAGADVSATKDVATKRGLGFVAIETTPEKLADAIAEFNSTAGDKARQPAYVYADESFRAGVLWYLHFRTADAMNDDAARVRAKPFGLTDQGDDAKAFDLAIQRFLESR